MSSSWQRPVVGDDADLAAALDVLDPHDAGVPREPRRALGRARLEQLDDARQAVGDVGLGHAAGVEGPHRELGARLADGLRGDDADCLTELDEPARRERLAVALRTDPVLGLAGERGADPDPLELVVVAHLRDELVGEHRALLDRRAVRKLSGLGEHAAVGAGLEVRARVRACR